MAAWAGVLLWVTLLAAPQAYAQGNASVIGTVVDDGDGSTLIGANVALKVADSPEIVDGTATDADGAFRLTGIAPGDYVLEVRFVGYQTTQRAITLEAGEQRDLTIRMQIQTASLDQVVVSASRRQEKVLDAPASISVLEPEEIQANVSTSTVEVLRATTGVDMAQTGIDRREVVLRGFNEAFSGSAFVLTDYREAAVPSLGVNVHSIMPNMSTDVARIEVVRGPGSALYGPGVTSGVIHYFTKDPFQYPGATISVSGGQQGFFATQGRVAGTFGDNWGVKVTGQFARANEWELDPNDQKDQDEIDRYRTYDTRDDVPDGRTVAAIEDTDDPNDDTDFQLRREDLYSKLNLNGLLQYRTGDQTTISLNGGYSQLKGVVQSGIGTLQADGFGYTYGQLRLQSGGLFAQVFVNANDAGDQTYVYGSGDRVIDKGIQWNGQVQYDFALPNLKTQFITGADANLTIPRTEGRILGRNEGDDNIEEYGLYVQSSSDLSEKFTLTLAGRADYNNVVETLQLSPRAAIVFKATPQNTFRASYNRAFSSPGTNSLFLDIEAQRQNISGDFDLVFRGLGAADGFTFNNFRSNPSARFILPTGVTGFDFGDDVSLFTYPAFLVYGAVAQGFDPTAEFTGTLGDLDQAARGAYAQLLGAIAQDAVAQTQGGDPVFASRDDSEIALGIPNDSPIGYREIDGPVDIQPLDQSTSQTFEAGYKGIISDKVIVQIDGYYEIKRDFIGPLVVESPLVYLDPQDFVAPDVQARIASNPQVNGAFQQFVQASGLSEQQAVELLAGTFGSTPSGVVQPDQNVLPGGGGDKEAGAFLSYRNFGEVQYYGADISVTVQATDALSIFSNASFVSDDFFDNEELDETNTSLSLALNAPAFKAKGGFDYRMDNGFSFGATSNYVEGFPVETGPYVGEVDSYVLVDVRAGYRFQNVPGLRLDVTANNVLDNEHRQFVGAPELGRLIIGRLTYTIE